MEHVALATDPNIQQNVGLVLILENKKDKAG